VDTYKKTARIVGILFLIAMVTSLTGGGLSESILNAPDYLISISANVTQIWIGVFLELIDGIAVVGIAVMLFPLIKQCNESMALGYVGFRFIESVFCTISAIIPLLLITLSREYIKAGTIDVSQFHIVGTLLKTVRVTYLGSLLIPVFFALGALLFYYSMFLSKLFPRFISAWGLIGTILMLIMNLIDFNTTIKMILAMPIVLNEIFLAFWLIIKGFNSSVINSLMIKRQKIKH